MKLQLIIPPLVHRTGDPFGNIPFMSTGVLYLAGFIRRYYPVSVLDCFGESPCTTYKIDDQLSASGLNIEQIIEKIEGVDLVGITIHSGMSHSFCIELAKQIRMKFPAIKIIAGGNHASVCFKELLHDGFDFVCIGEGEYTTLDLLHNLGSGLTDFLGISGLASKDGLGPPRLMESNLDLLGTAAWDLFPIENYWKLGMAHAPVHGKYIAITTSRGCPFGCRFCTTPRLLGGKWRTRSAKHIVNELKMAWQKYNIKDIIIQDEIFGLNKHLIKEIQTELEAQKLSFRFYLPSGVKLDALDQETILILKEMGLQYISIAPESGSLSILKKMNKPMDFSKIFSLVKYIHSLKISMGAFFILGFEDENDEDRKETRKLIGKLTRLGVDEISLFIWSPLPGADAYEFEKGWNRYEDLNWSPCWRSNWKTLKRTRTLFYLYWFLTKIIFTPFSCFAIAFRIITGRYRLKGEMAIRRLLTSKIRTVPHRLDSFQAYTPRLMKNFICL